MPLTVISGGAPGAAKPCPRPANDSLPATALARWRQQAKRILANPQACPSLRSLAWEFLRQHREALS
ncbi:MAG: hypothetical protein IH626_22965 [Rhodospirillales bacterium]|nr:hypothetical protein [Rhodospirillales bacterium]